MPFGYRDELMTYNQGTHNFSAITDLAGFRSLAG